MTNYAIQAEGISKYYGDKAALSSVDLNLEFNRVYCLIGRNGSGKSTLVKLLCREEQPTEGVLTFHEDCHFGYISSDLVFPGYLTLSSINQLFTSSGKIWLKERFLNVLKIFGLPLNAKFSSLSTGEKAGVKIAVMVAQKPNLWFIDEATLGIDIVAQSHCLTTLLEYFIEDKPCVIFCTHQISEIDRLAEEVIILEKGLVRWQGEKEALAESEKTMSETIYSQFVGSAGEAA